MHVLYQAFFKTIHLSIVKASETAVSYMSQENILGQAVAELSKKKKGVQRLHTVIHFINSSASETAWVYRQTIFFT